MTVHFGIKMAATVREKMRKNENGRSHKAANQVKRPIAWPIDSSLKEIDGASLFEACCKPHPSNALGVDKNLRVVFSSPPSGQLGNKRGTYSFVLLYAHRNKQIINIVTPIAARPGKLSFPGIVLLFPRLLLDILFHIK